jgi:hypothetical protein
LYAPDVRFADSNRGGRRAGSRWAVGIALAVLLAGAFLRLDGLDRIGLKGSDNTYYTNMALLWSTGERVYSIGGGPDLYQRPVAFFVNELAVRLLGFNDTSIKLVNAALDTVNIVLVFLLAYILSRRDLVAASSAAILYGLLPFTILIARSELTHVLSATTILTAMILVSLSWFAERRVARLGLALLGGIATGLSALTHEEMIFAAAAPALYLLLRGSVGGSGPRARLIAAMSRAGSYVLGVLAVAHVMLRAHQADAQVRATGIIGHRVSQGEYLRFLTRPLKFAWSAMCGSSSTFFACLVIVLMLVLAAGFIVRLRRERLVWRLPALAIEDLPLWTVVGYFASYSFFFAYYLTRLFVPLIPLIIAWWAVRSSSLLTRLLGPRASRLAVAVLTAAVAASNIGHIADLRDSMSSYYQQWSPLSFATDFDPATGWSVLSNQRTRTDWPRQRFEELGWAVTEDARLLVGASSLHQIPGRRVLQVGYYFGDNADFLIDHTQPVDQLIDERRIGFVLFTSYQTENWLNIRGLQGRRYLGDGRWTQVEHLVPGASLGLGDGEYSIQEEFERLRAVMARRGARIILGQRDLLTRQPSGTDPASYVVWALDPARWPTLERELEATSEGLALASEGHLEQALETLDAAARPDLHEMARFRLCLTAARLLCEAGQKENAARRVADAMSELPRNTSVSTALREAYPTSTAIDDMVTLFAGLQDARPKDRPVGDLMLAIMLTRTELAIEDGDRQGTIRGFGALARGLRRPATLKMTSAVAEWCEATARSLAEEGRADEAAAARAAASAGPDASSAPPDEPDATAMPYGEAPADDGF